jgi:hypothetical protein
VVLALLRRRCVDPSFQLHQRSDDTLTPSLRANSAAVAPLSRHCATRPTQMSRLARSTIQGRTRSGVRSQERDWSNGYVDPPSVDHITELASDLELVWNAATTDMALKKRIVRAVIEQIWADVDETRSEIVLTVHWKGGAHTDLRFAPIGTTSLRSDRQGVHDGRSRCSRLPYPSDRPRG